MAVNITDHDGHACREIAAPRANVEHGGALYQSVCEQLQRYRVLDISNIGNDCQVHVTLQQQGNCTQQTLPQSNSHTDDPRQ